MLLFYCASAGMLPEIRRSGAHRAMLWTSLESARRTCDGMILVVNSESVSGLCALGRYGAWAPVIGPEACINLSPYMAPRAVVAAGGVVVRPDVRDVILILRNGVWDLPKGKRKRGESTGACALREVREETGITDLRLGACAGETAHGYARRGRYHVKRTYWYLMTSAAAAFHPETREGIEQVVWAPWSEAAQRVGYRSLQIFLREIDPLAQAFRR